MPADNTELQACFVDLAEEDGITPDQILQLQQADPPWTGVIMQAANGLGTFPTWFPAAWKAAGPSAQNPNYGKTKFRMAYGYYVVGYDPVKQADTALNAVEAAGGWSTGDLALGVDIESGEQPGGLTAEVVIAGLTAYADRVYQRTQRRPILYGGSLIRQLGITSQMGCQYLWFPEWDDAGVLSWNLVEEMGWNLSNTLLWQDVGDGSDTAPPGYPTKTPVGGNLDISIMVLNNMPYQQQLQWLLNYCSAF
jgi:hypothetical protein